ncbi:hypothetical protein RQP52_33770 [Paenibacillus sp. PFR10]|uniref:Uncharacterized protein n=1 Tax=Paenibacillus violae TaxID=3077234 RepID=A0ABU3RP18_9BACL|nr:hypothetical protein [Paenibacillus sp. PFR10]
MADQVLAMSRKEALIAKEAIEKAGIIFALDMSLKRWPIHLAAKQVLESGRIGSVTSLRVRNAHSGALGGLGQQWPPRSQHLRIRKRHDRHLRYEPCRQ